MDMFTITVKHEGTKAVARLVVSPDAQHCALVPPGKPAVRFAGFDHRGCLEEPAAAACAAVGAVLQVLRDRIGGWKASNCGCEVCAGLAMEPLFDLVRESSRG